MKMAAHSEDSFRELLGYLAAGPTKSVWHGWQTMPISGGGNNLLFRATGELGDYAIKFTIRDERDRARREFAALRALQESNLTLAPKPILLDTDSYEHPAVIQSWLPGHMVQEAPHTDQDWSDWLEYLANVHELSPERVQVDLQDCLENANGGYAREAARLRDTVGKEGLSTQIVELTEKLRRLPLDRWEPVPTRLCRADHNIRNFIRHDGSLKSVDWEYSGWGDPAEDVAEMMAHATYMDVPESRWESVIDTYANLSDIENVRDRIRVCLAIKIVGWAVRLARSFEGEKSGRTRLATTGEWRVDTEKKYRYYLDRARNNELLSD